MKSPKFRPLDSSGTPISDPFETDLEPDPPEDPRYQRFDLRGPESLGAVARGDDNSLEPKRETFDLPPLNLNPPSGAPRLDEPRAAPIYIAAAVVSCLWALAPIMFALGYRRGISPLENDGFALAVFVLMAVGPVTLVWLSAFLFHQGARLAAQARRTQSMADNMIQPAALAARGVGSVVETVRLEIDHAATAAAKARSELLSLRDIVAEESERLTDATAGSSRNAVELSRQLGAERDKMNDLAGVLGAQASGVLDAISQHARMVAEATDLAETQIREAEASLAARAADLAAAAGEASDAARVAGEDLSRQIARLETASLGVGDQVRVLEESLTDQRASLVATAHGMRADHEGFSTEAETQRAQLVEILTLARGGAGELNETAAMTAEALRELVAQAGEQLHLMAQTASRERDLFGEAATQSLGAVSEIGLRQREAMESQTRETIDALSEVAARSLGAVSEIGLRQREALQGEAQAALDALTAAANETREISFRQREALEAQTRETIASLAAAANDAGEISLRQRDVLEARAREAIESLNAAAAEATEIGLRQHEILESRTRETIDALSAAAEEAAEINLRQRATLESQTRAALDALSIAAVEAQQAAADHGQALRDKVDQLSEASFAAAQQADAAFETRVEQARAMIEQSALMVEEASNRSTARLVEGVAAAQAASAALEELLGDIESRIHGLPQAAQAEAQAVRDSLDRGMADLLESARRTAEETQAIDAAFQDRVRRNYEMLSEAVRLMGVVAGAAGGSPRLSTQRPAVQPTPAPAVQTAPPAASPPAPIASPTTDAATPPAPSSTQGPSPAPAPTPAPSSAAPDVPASEAPPAGLRPRLKLTPTASDQEFKTVFEAAGGREPPPHAPATPTSAGGASDNWTWKELLSSMDEGMGETMGDDKALADRLIGEVTAMGIDAGALLPRMRIDQIAAAIQAGETAAGREIVRRIAPAAVRRLARRMIADRAFRAQVDRYVQRYAAMVSETRGEGQSFVISALLGSDQGRTFLMFDAALHDGL